MPAHTRETPRIISIIIIIILTPAASRRIASHRPDQTRQEKQTPNPKLETLQILAGGQHGPISHRTATHSTARSVTSPTDLILPPLLNLQDLAGPAAQPHNHHNNKPSRRTLVLHHRHPRLASGPIHSSRLAPAAFPSPTWTELSKARTVDDMAIWVGKQKMSW